MNLDWQAFKAVVQSHLGATGRFSAIDDQGRSRLLFRGQSDSRWRLASTLDRAGRTPMHLSAYLRVCKNVRRYTGNHLRASLPFKEEADCSYDRAFMDLPNYEYYAFLRHHGFPSPLLDWTASPYIAAFFAFRHPQADCDAVRIYSYRSDIGIGKAGSTPDPGLFVLGPLAEVHERHAMQQCWYSIAMREDSDGSCILCRHQDAFDYSQKHYGVGQDVLHEYDISISERDRAIADLSAMNINAFTLFGGVDALVETATGLFL